MKKPLLGLSACLMGESVRYDGGHKLNAIVTGELAGIFELFPICPEVESGLPVPREPMRLEGEFASPRLVGLRTRTDQTDKIMRWVRMKLDELEAKRISGYVFKARSPSCGPDFAEIFSPEGIVMGPGLFARALIERFPGIPVVDEVLLRQPGPREAFIKRVQAV